jgi:hypothetical protein
MLAWFFDNKVLTRSNSVHTMSESTHQPPSSQRAACNPYSQAAINESLAAFLESYNLPEANALRHPVEHPLRSNKRQKYGEHENNFEVRSHHPNPVFRLLLTSDSRMTLSKLSILRLMQLYLRLTICSVTRAQCLRVHINNLKSHQKVYLQVQGCVTTISY